MPETFTDLEIRLIKDELVKGENPNQIYLKLTQMGYTGSRRSVYRLARKLKAEDPIFKIDIQKAKTDLFYHNKYVMNFDKLEDIHLEWNEWWNEFKASDKKVGVFLVPRDCFKSTFFTIGASSQEIGNNPNVRINIFNAVESKAKEFLGVIKQNIRENPKYKYVYGDLYGEHLTGHRRNWTTMKITVVRDSMILADPTVAVAGISSAVAGRHCEYIFWDDLNNQLNVDQNSVRKKIINHWKLSNALLVPEGKGLLIATRWHDEDVAGWIVRNIPEDIMVFWRSARNRDGKKYFPSALQETGNLNATPPVVDNKDLYFANRLTQKFLEEQKRKLGTYLYNCQYENNPLPEQTRTFKEKYFRYLDRYFKNPYVYIIVDPAQSKKDQSADTGIIVVSTASEYATKDDGTQFIRKKTLINRAYKVKKSPSELVEFLFKLQHKWKSIAMGIEDVAYQKALKTAMEYKMQLENYIFNVETFKLPSGIKKDTRIRGLEPLYEDNLRTDGNRLYHYKHDKINYCADLEDQLLRFPIGTKKDLADCEANFPEFVTYPSPESSETEKMHPLIKKMLQTNRLRKKKWMGRKFIQNNY